LLSFNLFIEGAALQFSQMGRLTAESYLSVHRLLAGKNWLFRPRKNGGRAQRFCRPSCRRAFHGAARAWALDEFAAGRVTVGDFKNGLVATRALLPGIISPSPVLEAPSS
jgi:hypothetical protein